MKIYFDGKFTFDQYDAANKEYKRLAKALHPDTGGNASDFQELGRQWRAWKKGYEARQNNEGIGDWFNEMFRPHAARQAGQQSNASAEDVLWERMRQASYRASDEMFRRGAAGMGYGFNWTNASAYDTPYTQTPKPEPEPEKPKQQSYQHKQKVKNALLTAVENGCNVSLVEDGKMYTALALKDLTPKQESAMKHAGWRVVHRTVWEMEKFE